MTTTATKRTATLKELKSFSMCPGQRDHEARAATAAATYLAELKPPHLEISVAECAEDGDVYMLDGHTRRHVWTHSNLLVDPAQVPKQVNLTVYAADTTSDVVNLYTMFDNTKASKTTSDVVYGEMRSLGMLPVSAAFAKPSWLAKGLRQLAALADGKTEPVPAKGFDLGSALSDYRNAIMDVDAIQFGDMVVKTVDGGGVRHRNIRPADGMLAASVFIVHRDGSAALKFLQAVADGQGVKKGNNMNPVAQFSEWGGSPTRARFRSTYAKSPLEKYLADFIVVVRAYEAWMCDPQQTFTVFRHQIPAGESVLKAFHPYTKDAKKLAAAKTSPAPSPAPSPAASPAGKTGLTATDSFLKSELATTTALGDWVAR